MRAWWRNLPKLYEPTPAQWPVHLDPYRIKLVAGGERSGKSKSAAMYVLPRLLDADLIWIVAADYNLARPEFDYLDEALGALGLIAQRSVPVSVYQPASLRTTTGCLIRTVTAADTKKLAAVAPDGIIAAEAAQLNYESYLRLSGRIAEKRGWLLLEGTFESSLEWYADLWNEWKDGTGDGLAKSYSMPSWSNTVIFPGGLDDPEMRRLQGSISAGRFSERHGGVPVPPATVVFPEFSIPKHVGAFPFDPERPVELAIDPGYAGAYAVLALQWDNGRVYVVDEVYLQGKGAREVIHECRQREWWPQVRGGVIDIAGKQHAGMESHVEVWASPVAFGGAELELRSRYIPIEDGIERLRTFLLHPATGLPRVFFNAETTPRTQKEFRLYRYPDDKEGKAVREKPIDRDNHSIKALTYWLVNRFGFAAVPRRRSSQGKFFAPPKTKRKEPFTGNPTGIVPDGVQLQTNTEQAAPRSRAAAQRFSRLRSRHQDRRWRLA